MHFLHLRDRFVGELRLELLKRSDSATVEAVMERLLAQKLVDDSRLVQAILEANVGRSARDLSLLREKCASRGADPEALLLFESASSPSTEPLLRGYENSPKGRARAARFLASRGFDEDAIESAIENHFGPIETTEDN